MSPYSTAAKNLMLDSLALEITHVSAHSADPGDTGANELAGGAYARQPIAFNPAAAGAMDDSTNGAEIPVPAGATVAYIGFWDAAVAGNWRGSSNVTDEVFAGAGTYIVNDADLDLNA